MLKQPRRFSLGDYITWINCGKLDQLKNYTSNNNISSIKTSSSTFVTYVGSFSHEDELC